MKQKTTQISGFTLLEVMFVAAFTVMITGFLITNFSRTRSELGGTAFDIVSSIRSAQSSALSGTLLEGSHRCGYGIKFEKNRYFIYAGPDTSLVDCGTDDHVYDPGDTKVTETSIADGLEIVSISDIFFEPPMPKTYWNGTAPSPAIELSITVRERGKSCPSPACRTIIIHSASGQVRMQ